MSIKNFSLRRLLLLMRNDLFMHKRTMIIAASTIASIMLLFYVIFPAHGNELNAHYTFYILLLFIGGFLLTSSAFVDLHDRHRGHFYLTLPCSNIERMISKLILTSIVYAVVTVVFYYLFSLLLHGVTLVLHGNAPNLFNPARSDVWWLIGCYLILQSIFFLGSIYFAKHAMMKTIFSISCFIIALGLFTFFITWVCSWDYFSGGMFAIPQVNIVTPSLLKFAKILFWAFLAPFCWVVAYLRLRESEI